MIDHRPPEPDVFFLPLAVGAPTRFNGLDPWVLARRIPDFLHQLINQGEAGPTGMLEVQTPPGQGDTVDWKRFKNPPEPRHAFAMLPDDCSSVRAVIAGKIGMDHEGLAIELQIHNEEDLGPAVAATLQVSVPLDDPMEALCKLAHHLARMVNVPYEDPDAVLLTHSGPAFFKYLSGLDGSALLSEALAVESREDPQTLILPYSEALSLDPQFGLALRAAHVTLFSAVEESRLGAATCFELIDGYLESNPVDGEACVQVASLLVSHGEEGRAQAWLEHAALLTPPPPKSLENLGIIRANSGDTIGARDLWLDGLNQTGHPDFLAHLARLAFTEGDMLDAWDMVLRGLRRIYERCVRLDEWGPEGRELGLILRYLIDHLRDHEVPVDVVEALLDLRGKLAAPEDRVDLGKCLLELGYSIDCRTEIAASLGEDLDHQYRDDGVRVLLSLDFDDFDERFAKASEEMATADDPSVAMAQMEEFLENQPEYWPAHFLKALGYRRLGFGDSALDSLAAVLQLNPGQPDALCAMAELFDKRGNPKRALECVEEAMDSSPSEVGLQVARIRYLIRLDWIDAARAALGRCLELDSDNQDLAKLRDELQDRG